MGYDAGQTAKKLPDRTLGKIGTGRHGNQNKGIARTGSWCDRQSVLHKVTHRMPSDAVHQRGKLARMLFQLGEMLTSTVP